MTKSIQIASLSLCLMLAACGSQSSSNPAPPVASDRCSNEVVNTWNDILTESRKPARERKAEVVQASCAQFKTLMGTGTCKTPTDKSRVLEISARTVEGFCPDTDVVVNPTPAPVPQPQPAPVPAPPAPPVPGTDPSAPPVIVDPGPAPTPTPAPPPTPNPVPTLPPAPTPGPVVPPPPVTPASPKLKELTKGFRVIVRDEEAFFDLFSSGSEAVIQEGRIAHGSLQVIPGKSLCHAQKAEDFGDIRAGDAWDFPLANLSASAGNKITFLHQNKKLGFICGKSGSDDWTLADLTAIFGSKATVQVVE